MRGLLIAAGVLGIALVFGQCERAPASSHSEQVTSDDVQLVSEDVSADNGPTAGKNGNSGKNGRRRGSRVRFRI